MTYLRSIVSCSGSSTSRYASSLHTLVVVDGEWPGMKFLAAFVLLASVQALAFVNYLVDLCSLSSIYFFFIKGFFTSVPAPLYVFLDLAPLSSCHVQNYEMRRD